MVMKLLFTVMSIVSNRMHGAKPNGIAKTLKNILPCRIPLHSSLNYQVQ